MLWLVASVAGLFAGPLVLRAVRRARAVVDALDGYVVVGVAGLAVLHLLPHALEAAGWWAALAALLGLLLPMLTERVLAVGHGGLVALAVAGLALHTAADGAAIRMGDLHLGLGVTLHRIPVGLLVWWAVGPRRGAALLVGLAGATCLGFALGGVVSTFVAAPALGAFQAFVVGSLMHVVVHHASPAQLHDHEAGHDHGHHDFHDCHDHPEEAEADHSARWAGLGALGAGLSLAALGHGEHGHEHELVHLALGAAPALLLAYLGAGLVRAFVPGGGPPDTGSGLSAALWGVGLGLRSPARSCDLLPLYRRLLGSGAPAAAAVAVLLATPALSFEAVFLSIPFLGLELTGLRLVGAALVALLAALVVGPRIRRAPQPSPSTPRPGLAGGLRYGFGPLVDHTLPWVLLGLAVAAAFEPFADPAWWSLLPVGAAVLFFSLVGVPFYVCAAGITPVAAVLLQRGAPAGAVLALLLTAPTLSFALALALRREHGASTAWLLVGTVLGVGVAVGVGISQLPPPVIPRMGEPGPVQIACGLGLGALFVVSLLRQGPRGFIHQITGALHAH